MAKNYVTNFRGENCFSPSRVHVKDEPLSPEDFGENNDYFNNSLEEKIGRMRRSLSTSDMALLQQYQAMGFHDEKELKSSCRKTTGSTHNLNNTKYVSMAEAVYHFQRDTPGRFHSKHPKFFHSQQSVNGPLGLTHPQSPMLRCKQRSRPLHIMSQQEKEELELEEIRKFKIKANPVPRSVIEGSKNLPDVAKKPNTIPKPFKLTEVQKKVMQNDSPDHKFKARPVPKHIFENSQIPVKESTRTYLNVHSKPMKHERAKPKPQPNVEKTKRIGLLQPEPFSFEKRNEQFKKRKEEWIKQQIENERKQASQFKATPLPENCKKQMQNFTKSSSSTTSSENKENIIKFEARPAVVLYKEPFKPVLQPQTVKLIPFQLTTEKRAAEREKFDKHLKEKEEEMERLRLQKEKQRQEEEERAKAELRATLVHHAKPMPVKPQFIPEKSDIQMTIPETPKFIRRMRQT